MSYYCDAAASVSMIVPAVAAAAAAAAAENSSFKRASCHSAKNCFLVAKRGEGRERMQEKNVFFLFLIASL